MKKKNLVIVALASAAFAIAGGAALTSAMLPSKVTEVEATIAYDDGNVLSTIGFEAPNNDTAHWFAHVWGGSQGTTWPGIYLGGGKSGTNENPAVYWADVPSQYQGYTHLVIVRASDKNASSIWNRADYYNNSGSGDYNHSLTANTKNFFKFSSWWSNHSFDGKDEFQFSTERSAIVREYAVVDGSLEGEPFATERAWNDGDFNPTSPTRSGYSFDGWFTDSACSASYTAAPAAYDGKLYAKFTFDSSTNWVMKGEFDGVDKWADGLPMERNKGNVNEVKILDVDLKEGDVFKFNDAGANWYGYSDIKNGSALNPGFEAVGDNNILVKEGYGGSYNFYIDTSAEKGENAAIWITSDDYQALDGWAQAFHEDTDDLCDGEGDEWAKYAAAYGALSAGAKSFFAADKVEASDAQLASHIQKAAYRYEIGVANKGQTAFAEAQRPKNGFKDKYGALALQPKINSTSGGGMAAVAVTAAIGVGAAVGMVFIRRRRVL